MIRYLKQHFVDRKKYDHCVQMDERGLVYGFSWYLDCVCEHWDLLVRDDYAAVWPLPVRRKWGIKYFYRPYGVQQLGIFSKTPLQPEEIREFVASMQKHCNYADVYLNENQLEDLEDLRGIKLSTNLNLTLSLDRSFREIYHSYKKNTRRNVNAAAKNELQLFERDDPARLVEIFAAERGQSLSLPKAFFRNMQKLMYRCLHNNKGKVWSVYAAHNSLVAGAFIVETDKRHTLLFTANTEEGKNLGAMPYLINEYLIYHSETSKVFDFEGSNLPSLARFYQGFGAQSQHYLGLRYNGLALPLGWLKK